MQKFTQDFNNFRRSESTIECCIVPDYELINILIRSVVFNRKFFLMKSPIKLEHTVSVPSYKTNHRYRLYIYIYSSFEMHFTQVKCLLENGFFDVNQLGFRAVFVSCICM